MNFYTTCLVMLSLSLSLFGTENPVQQKTEFPLNLLFSRSDVPRILENTKKPLFRDFWQAELKKDFNEDNDFMREAFIYAITGDKSRGENAREGMLKMAQRKRWDYFLEDNDKTLGFLRGGRHTMWMCLSYDWCYDLLSPQERQEVLKQIASKGCEPLALSLYRFKHPETAGKWNFDPEYPYPYEVPDMSRWPVILAHNNFRAVIAGGLSLAVFTLQGIDNRVDQWQSMVLDSYDRFLELFGDDGSYDEGVSYCNYAMSYLTLLVEVERRKGGIDLFDRGNYHGMIDYALALYLPHDLEPFGSVNFGDAGNNLSSSVSFWVARHSRDGLAQYMGENFATRHDLFSLVFYDPTVMAEPPAEKRLFRKLDPEWITTRTGFDLDDMVVAMRSGPPTNHEHADRNSILLKAFGEILLADHKHPTYDPNNPGWLLRRAEAHNTVLIDGKSHPYHNGEEGTNAYIAGAKLVRWGRRSGYDFWASDATQAYSLSHPDVKSVTRTALVFLDLPGIVVIDKMIKKTTPSQFGARWHVEDSDNKGHCAATDSGFIIERPRGKFFATVAGTPGLANRTDFLPLPKEMGDFAFVETNTVEKAKNATMIMVGCALPASAENPEIRIDREDDIWHISVKKDGKRLSLRVFDRGELPEFSVIENSFVE